MQIAARLLLFVLFLSPALNGQQSSARLWKGTLHDSVGAPINRAEIHLIGGHGELVAHTRADGSFQFASLPPASYQLAVVIAGVAHNAPASIDLTPDSHPAIITIDQQGTVTVTFQPRPRKHTRTIAPPPSAVPSSMPE